MDYFISSENDIIHLKKNLMTEDKSTTKFTSPKEKDKDIDTEEEKSKVSSISSEVRRILNEKTGEQFELNIKETLKLEMNFNETSYSKNFIYMRVDLEKNKKIFVREDIDKEIDVNGVVFVFKLSKERICSIINKKDGSLYCSIEEIKEIKKQNINGKQLIFHPFEEIEIDGIYSIDDFDVNCFDKKEVSLISSHVKKDDFKTYEMAIIEVKLSPKKVLNLISQMKKDSKIMKNVVPDKKIIYLGFLGSKNIDSKVNFPDKLKNIDYAIYGLNNNKFFNRKVFEPLDWNLIEKVENVLNDLNNNVKEILEWIKDRDPEFKRGEKADKMLSKKRERVDAKK
jgi:hypothetical protein